MNLRPLGDRVLVKPDPRPTETASGLQLAEQAWRPEFTGVVVAVGAGVHPRREEACEAADQLEQVARAVDFDEQIGLRDVVLSSAVLLRALVAVEPAVQPGDRILFGANAGMVTHLNDERYFIMRESDILAVLG